MFGLLGNLLTLKEDSLSLHRILKGKIEISSRISADNIFETEGERGKGTLSSIYTPGVAYVSEEIRDHKDLVYEYTSKWNNIAIVCDGTRVLGLGNVGPESALPVMEGKSVLFKTLANVNAFPLCISITDKEDIIRFVRSIEPSFGAINIEDIESPKVLEIVEALQNELTIPVFHDDRHGTAVITLAALINSLRLLNKKTKNVRIVIAGAGSAGYGIFRILLRMGFKSIIVVDKQGAIYEGREPDIEGSDSHNQRNRDNLSPSNNQINPFKKEIALNSNKQKIKGDIVTAIEGADVFIGTSGKGGLLNSKMIKSMNKDPIIFALSNPDPEILPAQAINAGAAIVATGRSDFPNQINNAVVFPAIFRALLDLRIRNLSEDILIAVSKSIADLVDIKHLSKTYIVPKINDPRILPVVTKSVKEYIIKRHDK
ncbi:putative NAD-dependent malic enzyme 4 [Candidatus Nitrosocosmicus franklandus]|uniref:Putative NAD-dependent malic enzyme 4 n=1 Tax=Candidatus Nitrosocosmicus franklandianus TaxID=1798806 RepID=A0A484I6B7_9ARCH|nr:putative NAD-dependent malic enzyme 4 [Candidatus Nitrosocosmicus franklandus]